MIRNNTKCEHTNQFINYAINKQFQIVLAKNNAISIFGKCTRYIEFEFTVKGKTEFQNLRHLWA